MENSGVPNENKPPHREVSYEPLTPEELERLKLVPNAEVREQVAEELAYPMARQDTSREEAQAIEHLAQISKPETPKEDRESLVLEKTDINTEAGKTTAGSDDKNSNLRPAMIVKAQDVTPGMVQPWNPPQRDMPVGAKSYNSPEKEDLGVQVEEAAKRVFAPAAQETAIKTETKSAEIKPEENIPANIAVAPETPEKRPASGSVLTQEERERIFGKPVSKKTETASEPKIAEKESEIGARIPVMVTRGMEQQLRGMGMKDVDIDKLTPEEAWKILNKDKDSSEKPEKETETEKSKKEEDAPKIEKTADKSEQKEEPKEKEKTVAEKVAEKELEKDVHAPVVLMDARSKNIFRHLSDYTQGVFEGLRHAIPDRVALAYNSFLGGRYDRRLQSKTQEHQDLRKAIDKVSELIRSSDEAVLAMRRDGVEIGVDRIETYKKDLEYQKAVLNSDESSLMRKIDGISGARGRYFEKRDSICERMINVYDGRIKTIEEENQKAVEMTRLLEQQIGEKRLQKDKIRERLKTLEDRLAENKLPFFAKEIKKAIKLADKTLRGTEKLILEEKSTIKKSNERAEKIKKKNESYKGKRDGYKKIIQQQAAAIESPESQHKEPGRAGAGVSSAEGGAEVEKSKKVGEGIRKYMPSDLIKKWNSVNSGVLRIDEEKMKPLFAEEAWSGGISYPAFGEAINDYIEKLPEDTEDNVKIKRSIVKNKKKIKNRRGWLGSILDLNI